MIFQYFSCHGAGDITHMNMMEFVYFCHVCRIPDKHVTMGTIDQVFRRVNIEEVNKHVILFVVPFASLGRCAHLIFHALTAPLGVR